MDVNIAPREEFLEALVVVLIVFLVFEAFLNKGFNFFCQLKLA